jgi:hypothetical protein
MPENNTNINKKRKLYILIAIIFVMLIFLPVLGGVFLLKKRISENNTREMSELFIVLKDDVWEVDKICFQKKLELKNYVMEMEYLSEEETKALNNEKQKRDFNDDLSSVIIKIKVLPVYFNKDSILVIQNEIKDIAEVENVFYEF